MVIQHNTARMVFIY
jgi:hypothetical protein